ncbi:hypothetical protein StoSoilB13_31760 (plasmid) [Arthrobacter sp. StoSoilB13]|nr:hypothetical protein StoSoilB13_31760 [Arthrobacter sp. StoSoilB13]
MYFTFSAMAPAVSTPVGPPPTTTTSTMPSELLSALIQQPRNGGAQPGGVGDGVQRKSMFPGAWCVEEVGNGTYRNDEDVRPQSHAIGSSD